MGRKESIRKGREESRMDRKINAGRKMWKGKEITGEKKEGERE